MNTCKVDLLLQAVKYFAVHLWEMEQAADLAYGRLLDKAKSHESVMVENHQDKENWQDSTTFPTTVSTSIGTVYPSESCRRSTFRTCSRCGLTHIISGILPYLWCTMWPSTIGSAHLVQGHPLDSHPEEQKMNTPGQKLIQILIQRRKEPISKCNIIKEISKMYHICHISYIPHK